MIVKDGASYYPLRTRRGMLGGAVCYDRDHEGKSWFILDLALDKGPFIPEGSGGLVTADGKRFIAATRRQTEDSF